MLLGAWWDLLLGRSEEFDEALEDNVRANKADSIVWCEEANFQVEDFNPSLDGGEGVTRLLLEIIPFLGVEGLMSFVSSQLRL